MKVDQCIGCVDFPCQDVRHDGYIIPDVAIDPGAVSLVMVAEAAPAAAEDYFYAPGEPLFAQTTILAFNDAGANVSTVEDLLSRGVYLTTAVKCAKQGYALKAATVRACSRILERELALFPDLQVLMLMGDVAIRAVNYIAKRNGDPRVIPTGSTYKIRGDQYSWRGRRVFPSYLQAGRAFFIEKSKRRMIAEDLHAAVDMMT